MAIVPVGIIIAPINYFAENGLTYPHEYGSLDVFAVFLVALMDVLGRACRTCAVQEHTASTVALGKLNWKSMVNMSYTQYTMTYGAGWAATQIASQSPFLPRLALELCCPISHLYEFIFCQTS